MTTGIDLSETKAMLSAAARAVIANKDRLTKADQDIGDGDHGVGMARGFAAFDQATAKEVRTLQELFRACGQALMMASGGASGVVFGTLFQGAANGLKGDVFDAEAFVLALEGGLRAVQDRGKAKLGDKTMVDALAPAADAARKALDSGASLEEVATAAAKGAAGGVEATRGLVAKIGKAKGLGERTVGFIDPGALTTSVLLDSIAETLRNRPN
jgi:phosphoenolpyruvate---glycerone phosphotransferase subunit DhaL